MEKKHLIPAVFLILITLIAGCSVKRNWVATGGSKADGTVVLSYEIGRFQTAVLDYEEGLATAKRRCASWGYKAAEAFGGESRNCVNFGSSGCIDWQINKSFQCIN